MPNALLLPGVACGLGAHLAWDGWCSCAAALATAFIAGLVIVSVYSLGGFGAAEGKLLISIACVDGPLAFGRTMIVTIIVACIALAFVIPVARRVATRLWSIILKENVGVPPKWCVLQAFEKVESMKRMNLPYTAIVASGCITTFMLSVVGGAA